MAVLGGGKESLLPSLTHSHVKTSRSSAVVWWSISVLGKCTAFIYSGEYEFRGNHSRPISIVSTLQIALLNIHYDSANHFFPAKPIFTLTSINIFCRVWSLTVHFPTVLIYVLLSHVPSLLFFPSTLCLHSLTHMLMGMYNVEQWRVFVCD